VRVAVEGELYAGVTREVLDELGVHAPAEKQSEARVPEIMPANVGQSCSLEQGLEMAVDDVDGLSSYKSQAPKIFREPIRSGKVGRPKLMLAAGVMVARWA
jgi:hypothetical protein